MAAGWSASLCSWLLTGMLPHLLQVEHVDEDMREAIKIINSRLPPGGWGAWGMACGMRQQHGMAWMTGSVAWWAWHVA